MYVTALYHFSLERHFITICSQSASHQARKYETRLGGGLRCTNKLINVYPCCIYYAFSIISLTAYHFSLYSIVQFEGVLFSDLDAGRNKKCHVRISNMYNTLNDLALCIHLNVL